MSEKIKERLFVDEYTSINYTYWIEDEVLILETGEFETFEDIVLVIKDLNDKHVIRFGRDGACELNRVKKIEYC